MKKLLLSSFAVLSLIACQNRSGSESSSYQPTAQQHNVQGETISDYEEAKSTLDELLMQGERLKKGEISKEKHDALTYPLGQKFRSLRAGLSESDREKLKEYSHKRFDEVYPAEERIDVTNENI